ncbi:MAG TPA: hypothetical protein PK816_14635 [Candidatus Cloacimonadota bacterium]|nr:hypothetical protein [Candidatus Cloacimonadota bacterium]
MTAKIGKLKKAQLVVDENATHVELIEVSEAGEAICNMLKINEDESFTTLAHRRVFESVEAVTALCTVAGLVEKDDYVIDGVN